MHRLLRQAHERGHTPRVHGNGFIQLDISDEVRLHVWGHPAIPRQKVETPIHDHQFSFSSIILVGALTNVLYIARPTSNGTHWPYKALVREKQDTILVPCNVTVPDYLHCEHKKTYRVGEGYSLDKGIVHESIPEGLSASIIIKRGKTLAQGGMSPRVWVPHGSQPDNDFNRYSVPADRLWDIISEVLG